MDHNKVWKILKDKGIIVHLTCLLRNLYAGQKATEHCVEQLTSSGLRKEYSKSVYCHPVYLTYIEYIMRNAGLDELQAGIKIAGRNINNLTYADDTAQMAESKEKPKSLLMRVKKESNKAGLKLTLKKLRSWHSVPSLHGR